MLTNWKTTLTAIIGAIASLIALFGIHVPSEIQIAIVTIVVFLIGVFAKDAANDEEA